MQWAFQLHLAALPAMLEAQLCQAPHSCPRRRFGSSSQRCRAHQQQRVQARPSRLDAAVHSDDVVRLLCALHTERKAPYMVSAAIRFKPVF